MPGSIRWYTLGCLVAPAFLCACSQGRDRGDSSIVDGAAEGGVSDARADDAPIDDGTQPDQRTPSDGRAPIDDAAQADQNTPSDGRAPDDGRTNDIANDGPKPPDGSSWCDAAPPPISRSDASAPESCYLPSNAPVVCLTASCSTPPMPVVDCGNRMWTTLLSSLDGPQRVQADSQGVYWQSSTALLMQKAGTMAQEVLVFRSEQAFAIDDDFVYFEGSADGGPASIEKIKRDRTERSVVGPGGKLGFPLLLDRDRIYFNTDDGRVASIPKAGGSLVDAGIGVVSIVSVRVDDTHFFWVESSTTGDTVRRAAKDSLVTETLASGLPAIRGLLLEGAGVLLLSDSNVLEIPKQGGCPRVLATTAADWLPVSKRHTPLLFAADETGIYWWGWSSLGDIAVRSLWRAPRTGGAMASMYSSNFGSNGPDVSNLILLPSQLLLQFEKSIGALDRR